MAQGQTRIGNDDGTCAMRYGEPCVEGQTRLKLNHLSKEYLCGYCHRLLRREHYPLEHTFKDLLENGRVLDIEGFSKVGKYKDHYDIADETLRNHFVANPNRVSK